MRALSAREKEVKEGECRRIVNTDAVRICIDHEQMVCVGINRDAKWFFRRDKRIRDQIGQSIDRVDEMIVACCNVNTVRGGVRRDKEGAAVHADRRDKGCGDAEFSNISAVIGNICICSDEADKSWVDACAGDGRNNRIECCIQQRDG